MKLAIVLVHYHTPWLVGPAVEALRADLALSPTEHEILLVDNGSEPGDHDHFEALGLRVLGPGSNLGFAAGFNRGAEASGAEILVAMNPDVLVRPGCFAPLIEALDEGAAAAGPRFSWDDQDRLLLPPTEPRTRRWELAASLATRGPRWAAQARHRWRRHAWAHWNASSPIESYHLSGALLALRRDVWQRIGPFDDGYRLYFEETDWLCRLHRAHLPAVYVPAARAYHRYNLSAVQEPRAEAWFAESCGRFRRRHYGAGFSGLLDALARIPGAQSAAEAPPAIDSPALGPPAIQLAPGAAWVELSPAALGFPAAGERLQPRREEGGGCWTVPSSVWNDLAPGAYTLRTVDDTGRELGAHAFRKQPTGDG